MKHLAAIAEFFVAATILALVLHWVGGHAGDSHPWIPIWTHRLAVVGFLWALALSLVPAAHWLEGHRQLAEQRRAEARDDRRQLADQRRPVREQLRQHALFYEQKYAWTVELPPAERRVRALQNYDQVMSWPEEDRDLRAVLANDHFEIVGRELRSLADRLLQILDARLQLYQIAVLNLDVPARAAHQLREQRAIQQHRVREAREAAVFGAETDRILAEGNSGALVQDVSCCPLATLMERQV